MFLYGRAGSEVQRNFMNAWFNRGFYDSPPLTERQVSFVCHHVQRSIENIRLYQGYQLAMMDGYMSPILAPWEFPWMTSSLTYDFIHHNRVLRLTGTIENHSMLDLQGTIESG